MDLHDFDDVAANYDHYVAQLTGGGGDVVRFHLDLAREHSSQGILDIACGTGATLLTLVEAGFPVTGIDISPAMLAVLRDKLAGLPADRRALATLIAADMVDFEAVGPFSLAIIARSGFMHLLTSEAQEAALRNIHGQLVDGGILSFNTFDPNYGLIAENLTGSNPAAYLRGDYVNARGNRERIWNAIEFDPETQTMGGDWRFEELDADGNIIETRTRPLRMRWSFEPEIRHLLRLCDFELLDVYGSYDKEPRTYGGGIVWVARKGQSNA